MGLMQPEDMYEQLMHINREAFAAAHYNTAYHALASALHCAFDLGDSQRLTSIENTAKEQLKFIDSHAPTYEHSTPSSQARGHTSIFAHLAKQAHVMTLILKHNRQRKVEP